MDLQIYLLSPLIRVELCSYTQSLRSLAKDIQCPTLQVFKSMLFMHHKHCDDKQMIRSTLRILSIMKNNIGYAFYANMKKQATGLPPPPQ